MEPITQEPDSNARNWGMLAHLLTLLGYLIGFGHVIPPLVIYLAKKDGTNDAFLPTPPYLAQLCIWHHRKRSAP